MLHGAGYGRRFCRAAVHRNRNSRRSFLGTPFFNFCATMENETAPSCGVFAAGDAAAESLFYACARGGILRRFRCFSFWPFFSGAFARSPAALCRAPGFSAADMQGVRSQRHPRRAGAGPAGKHTPAVRRRGKRAGLPGRKAPAGKTAAGATDLFLQNKSKNPRRAFAPARVF